MTLFQKAAFEALKADQAKAEARRQAALPKPAPVKTPVPPVATPKPPVAVKVTAKPAVVPLTPSIARAELVELFVKAGCARAGAVRLAAGAPDAQALKLARNARKARGNG